MTTRQEMDGAVEQTPGYTLIDKETAAAQRKEVLSVLLKSILKEF